jgi:DNA gyrase/topoisomerase IV subunit B
MKGSKAITIIGILIMVLVGASYVLFEAFVKDTSNLTAQNVVVAKTDIPEGTVIHNADEAKKFFTVKRISSDNLVEGVIVVNRTDLGNAGLLAQLQDKLGNQEVNEADVKQLIGYKITRTYAPNEQILAEYVSTDVVEFDKDERLFAIETSYINSVAAEINEGDYVDLWLVSSKNDETISKRLRELAFLNRGLTIKFTDLRDDDKFYSKTYKYDGGLIDYVLYLD